jgi:hypothetical protein
MARRRATGALSSLIMQRGIRNGLLGGNRGWLVTLLAFRGLVAAKRSVTRSEQLLTIDKLKPGEQISVRTIPVKSAKERKQLLKGQRP